MKLSLHTLPQVPLEAETISPGLLLGKSASEVAALPVFHGNNEMKLGDFFSVTSRPGNDTIEVEGDLSKVKLLGYAMNSGRLVIHGNVGAHLGAAMSGGEIIVEGNTGDWAGREMSGGRIVIKGNTGHMLGSAVRGAAVGMLGGEIFVHGSAGNETGHGMRRGLIAIGRDSGDFTGVNMRAGSIIVLGKLGQRPGAGLKRGTIVSMEGAELLPTFTYDCIYRPTFLSFYLLHLRKMEFDIADEAICGNYERWSGDSIELNRGEILLYVH
jgi:formylmethanofuran dehydrogenase subunit C